VRTHLDFEVIAFLRIAIRLLPPDKVDGRGEVGEGEEVVELPQLRRREASPAPGPSSLQRER